MIYGDDPRTKEYEDYLGLNDYTVKLVDYAAVRQSGNLYGYCGNNPERYIDSSGEAVGAAIAIIGGLMLLLTGCNAQDGNAWIEQNANYKNNYKFEINSSGYYGVASSGNYVRNISGGLAAAESFFAQKTVGYVKEWRDGIALMREMEDGTVYTFRETSSSDGTPAVSINSNNSTIKSQKIHFVD